MALAFGAIGVVFGDIGTSPLYALRETFAGHHPIPIDRSHVLGVLSLVFWTVTTIVPVNYVTIMMRADNRGEGGTLVLLALAERAVAGRRKLGATVGVLGIVGAALFYGDSMITPAISVLSAVEGLKVATPRLAPFVIPITIAILVALFLIQRRGAGAIGSLFGPVMVLWFATLAVLGVVNIAAAPSVLWALSPHHAVRFFFADGWVAFLALGSVFLAVTGAEALYADMGHFGRLPIRIAWYAIVLPALLLNYFGQGALLLSDPSSIVNPFFKLAPAWAALPLVVLATLATIFASQAVISGAFSMTQQAMHLGYVPRMRILHTSESERGQIYVPFVNWTLLVAVVALVLFFQSSSDLAAAYGLAVSGTMLLDTVLLTVVMIFVWRWGRAAYVLAGLFLIVDVAFLGANATKIPYGGWFPLLVALAAFALLTSWKAGRERLSQVTRREALSIKDFVASLSAKAVRVPGTAVFLTGNPAGVPPALLHNLKHNKVIHERNILLTVTVDDTPRVAADARIEAEDLGDGFRRIILHYGFTDSIDVPKALANARLDQLGFVYEPMSISYFLSRETLVPSPKPAMSPWRQKLYLWMARSATGTLEFFQLPKNRVVELGTQVEI
jgi:KUP system potassium uptake protein